MVVTFSTNIKITLELKSKLIERIREEEYKTNITTVYLNPTISMVIFMLIDKNCKYKLKILRLDKIIRLNYYAVYKQLCLHIKTQIVWRWMDGKKISNANCKPKKERVGILL